MEIDKYAQYDCPECKWTGEGVELTESGECPECYTILVKELE